MATEPELTFADQVGRFYQQNYAMPPMVGRVVGWLLICDPPQQTVAEISEALTASRSAVGTALSSLETIGFLRRTRVPGERADRVGIHPAAGAAGLESPAEYGGLAALARSGLDVLKDAPPARRSRLLEMSAFADFLLERLPVLADEWRARREALIASGDLPKEDET